MAILSLNISKLLLGSARFVTCFAFLLGFEALGASGFLPEGGESALVGNLPADQSTPAVALNAQGGYVVWQDAGNGIAGGGIRARRVSRTANGSLVGSFSPFWINSRSTGEQELPQVALRPGGGAVFVWQTGPLGESGVVARFLKSSSGSIPQFEGDEIEIAPAGSERNIAPQIIALGDGSMVVAWAHFSGPDSLMDVFTQKLSADGRKVGPPLQVNLTTDYHQRSPALAALQDGNYVVAWISENQRFDRSADVYARIFSPSGFPLAANEMRLNYGTNICSSPSLVALPNGGFAAAWSEYDYNSPDHGWDSYIRTFDASAVAQYPSLMLNAYQPHNQINPKLAVAQGVIMAVWTSFEQDGSREGVFGRYLSLVGQPLEDEFGLNQTVISQQMQPAVTSDNDRRFLSVWTAFNFDTGFDLVSRKFVGPAAVLAPHCVISIVSDGVKVAWSTESGANYQLQQSTDLLLWEPVGTPRLASSASDSVILQLGQAGSFFRILRQP